MTVDVVTELEIARPRADVARFAADPTNATAWYRNIRRAGWQTPPPLTVGSRFLFTARFLGRTLEYTYEVLEYDPLERLVMATTSGPFAMETTYGWADTSAGTLMTLRNRGEPQGYFAMMSGAVSASMRRANRADLARLKGLLER